MKMLLLVSLSVIIVSGICVRADSQGNLFGELITTISLPVPVPPSPALELSITGEGKASDVAVKIDRDERMLFRYVSRTNGVDLLVAIECYRNGFLNGASMYRTGLFSTFCVTLTNSIAEGPYFGAEDGRYYRGVMAEGNIRDGVSWCYSVDSNNHGPQFLVYSNALVVGRTYDISRISKEVDNPNIPRLRFDLNENQLSEAYRKMAEGDKKSAGLLYRHSVFLTSKRLLSDLLLTVSALLGNNEGNEIYRELSEKKHIHFGISKDSLQAIYNNDKTVYLMILDFAQKIDFGDYDTAESILKTLKVKGLDDVFLSELDGMLQAKGDLFTRQEWADMSRDL